MSDINPLIEARAELYERGLPTDAWLAYWQKAGPFDHAVVAANCGSLSVLPVEFTPDGFFDLPADEGGTMAAVIEVFSEDGETVLDLLAWPLNKPERFATFAGRGQVLGLGQIENAATYFLDQPLRVHRTPLRWLQSGCTGAVILDPPATHLLGGALGRIAGEDLKHARELARALASYIDPREIGFITTDMRKAA